MKHIKTYKPKIGAYVVIEIKFSTWLADNVIYELEHNIGKIVSFNSNIKNQNYEVTFDFNEILYSAFTKNSHNKTWLIDISEILFWSKDKERCEIFMTAKKYNI